MTWYRHKYSTRGQIWPTRRPKTSCNSELAAAVVQLTVQAAGCLLQITKEMTGVKQEHGASLSVTRFAAHNMRLSRTASPTFEISPAGASTTSEVGSPKPADASAATAKC